MDGGVLTIDDLFAVRWLSDPQLAPDGQRVACVESRVERGPAGMRSRIIVIGVDDRAVCTPSPDDALDGCPRWSPDGSRLAFTSDRGDGARVGRADPDGSRAEILPASPAHVTDIAWHPDGRRLAVAFETRPDATQHGPHQPAPDLLLTPDGPPLERVARTALAIIDGDASVRVVHESLGVIRRPAWSPDGSLLAFWKGCTGPDPRSQAAAIWLAGADGGTAAPLTPADGPVAALAWSPDGRRIAWLGHTKGECLGLTYGIRIVSVSDAAIDSIPIAGEPALGLTVRSDDARGTLDDASLAWVQSGGVDRLYTRWSEGGRTLLGWVDEAGAPTPVVTGDRAVLGASIQSTIRRIAFVAAGPDGPGEVSVCGLDGESERRLSSRNETWSASRRLGRTERFEARAADGQVLEGWLTRPPDGVAHGRAPLILSVHGGPHYPVGWRFSFEHQRLAARGYAVLSGNPRGSAGYGDRFSTAIHGDWGGVDHADLMALVDGALDLGGLDPQRLAVMGVSYGGYMTLWSVSQDRRFRVAISENGIADLVNAYGTSHDGGLLLETELGGTPWEAPQRYRVRSPLWHAASIDAAVLLIHGERDRACPIGQSEEMLTALRRHGRTVSLLPVPGEGHLMNLVGSGAFRQARAEAVDAWLGAHL